MVRSTWLKLFPPRNSDPETIYDPARLQVLINNLVDIIKILVTVPDPFRIDHRHRPLAAAIETAGAVDPYPTRPVERQLPYTRFGVLAESSSIVLLAAGATIHTPVGTEKDVVAVKTHGGIDHPYSITRQVGGIG
jgi:hypothetical protein